MTDSICDARTDVVFSWRLRKYDPAFATERIITK